MVVKMELFWISLIISVIGSNAAGEFSVLHSPKSLKFTGSNGIMESALKEVFSASLGLSVEEGSDWNGLHITDPFNVAEAVVEVYVDGVSSVGKIGKGNANNYLLVVDEYEPDTFESVRHRIKQRFSSGANKLVNIRLSDEKQINSDEVFGPMKPQKPAKQTLQHLKYSVEEDTQFLKELQVLTAITEKVKSGAVTADNIADFYNFRFSSLHALSDYHGPDSLQTKEAKKLLGAALEQLTSAFVSAYEGSVVVALVSTDVAHTRRAPRSVAAAASARDDEDLNLADSYSADYPAIFNIILWFGVVFVFALIAIVYALMDMDPGRDSIIYRMTSTRMKKDN